MFDSMGVESTKRDTFKRANCRRHVAQIQNEERLHLFQYAADDAADNYSRESHENTNEFSTKSSLDATVTVQDLCKPKDSLNLFSWAKADDVPQSNTDKNYYSAADCTKEQLSNEAIPNESSEFLRHQEAQKFTLCTNGRFLNFSNAEEASQKHHIGKGITNRPASNNSEPYGSPKHGMLDGLTGNERSQDPHWKRESPKVEKTKKEEPENVQGFPGLGTRVSLKKTGRKDFRQN